jgi:hypothetical protein
MGKFFGDLNPVQDKHPKVIAEPLRFEKARPAVFPLFIADAVILLVSAISGVVLMICTCFKQRAAILCEINWMSPAKNRFSHSYPHNL